LSEESPKTTGAKASWAEGLLDREAVAKLLGVTGSWVKDHTTRVEPILPHIKMARKVRFRVEDIERFVHEHFEHRPRWERKPPQTEGRVPHEEAARR
jgi:hypothetical protein